MSRNRDSAVNPSRAVARLLALFSLFVLAASPTLAQAQPRARESRAAPRARAEPGPSPLFERSFLAGGGPRTTGRPVSQPYFVGWSTDLSGPGPSLLRITSETGGVAVDPRSGWVYATSREGRLTCLVDGRVRWEQDLGAPLLAAPALHQERVVTGDADGVLHVLNKVTGERIARSPLGEELVTVPVIAAVGDDLVAFVGSVAESVFAVELGVGRKLWRAHRDPPAGFTVRGMAQPLLLGETLFAGFADGVLSALEPATGVVQWERRLSPPGDLLDVDALAADGERLYVTSYSGGVFAVDPRTGDTVWRTPLRGASRLTAGGALVYAAAPGVIQALRASDGRAVWQFRLEDPRVITTPVLSAGLVAFAEAEGPLYFLDRHSGRPEGVFAAGPGFSSAPATAGRAVFALSDGGRVYSLGLTP